ncbi:pilus assembly protein [Acidovorax sp. NCPPB 3859]|nr:MULTISPECIES: TfpX/TfpZ family type IV pilin accessory protein [unclassified Acidovorax]MDA8452449.1 pilus assembly protein [Acidovorax sp. GBBC 3297]MDA8461855.1 pilus assembly protein [Acidovorax sp. GBBC 3333]MDA8466888.1 pilus assembly protein [Acidovorax sp. GBBC 3332]MDA8471924.1 pilus assembly protein [Acidovorax sp. GBBC 3299]WCM78560.1 pilus assembly protein [Acidovorax sp. GBBC 712]
MTAARSRFRAFAVHLACSLVVVLSAWLLVGKWYPHPYIDILGGGHIFLVLVFVDFVAGPCLTFLIFNEKKSRRELAVDISVVALLQAAALSLGVWTMYTARPVYLVFEYSRMAVVTAADVKESDLQSAPESFRKLPADGPRVISLRTFKNAAEEYDSVVRAMAGQPQAAQPNLWQPYESARTEILKVALPLASLMARKDGVQQLSDALAATGLPADKVKYLPLQGRERSWTVLLDGSSGAPVGFAAVDSFQAN